MGKYLPDIEQGIAHIEFSGSDASLDKVNRAYEEAPAKGRSISFSLGGYHSVFSARTLLSYFRDENILATKRNAYAAAKARRMELKYTLYHAGLAYPDQLLYPLLSDNKEMIHWYGQFFISALQGTFKRQLAYKLPCQVEHYTLQMSHAVLGNWDILARNCEAALQESPKDRKSYQIDYAFLLGLARGSVSEMETALAQLFKGRVLRARCTELGFGSVQRLMFGWGFILYKLAWLHGYQLEINSPWIPKDLLAIEPLADVEYKSGIEVIDDYDLFTPFEDDPKRWCKNASIFSPKPLGQQLNVEELIGQLEWGELPCGSKLLIKINEESKK
jgi:hypothetical protein